MDNQNRNNINGTSAVPGIPAIPTVASASADGGIPRTSATTGTGANQDDNNNVLNAVQNNGPRNIENEDAVEDLI